MAAAKSRQAPEVLAALIELRADVNARSNNGMNCAFLARSPEQVGVLMRFKADLHAHCDPLGLTPLSGVAAMASPETVRAMLEARCDPNPTPRGVGHGVSASHSEIQLKFIINHDNISLRTFARGHHGVSGQQVRSPNSSASARASCRSQFALCT